MTTIGSIAKNSGQYFLAATYIATSPIIAIVAIPILAGMSIFYKSAEIYHSNRNLINATHLNEPFYRNNEPEYFFDTSIKRRYSPMDLKSLEHEKKRIESEEGAQQSFKDLKFYSKCLIPVIGYIWAAHTYENWKGLLDKAEPKQDSQAIKMINHHLEGVRSGVTNY